MGKMIYLRVGDGGVVIAVFFTFSLPTVELVGCGVLNRMEVCGNRRVFWFHKRKCCFV